MSEHTRAMPPEIRGIIKYRLEHYHLHRQELASTFSDLLPSNTAQLTHERKAHSNVSRNVEDIAVSIAENTYLREIEKSVNAIEYVVTRLSDEDKKIIELVYWRKTHTLTGAGTALNMSRRTVYRHADGILTALAKEMGLMPAML